MNGIAGSAPEAGTGRSAGQPVDVAVIGGGINGVSIARDAAGRGLSVLLCEQDDLAAHTSSASSKMIHGGLRYLEYGEFGLVRKALQEREILMSSAAHLIHPLRLIMPHTADQRPAWLIRFGLLLYDHLASRRILPASAAVDLRTHVAGQALQARYRRGFAYSDGWVNDARLVVLNALDAAERGAQILTRTRCVSAQAEAGIWRLELETRSGRRQRVMARSLVNASGPWVAQTARSVLQQPVAAIPPLRLVRGSHIVVPALFAHDCAYLLQHSDGRVVFALPYEQHFTLIGTTDVDQHDDPGQAQISADEIAYLCGLASSYFARPVRPADVVHSFSGVRPLLAGDGNGEQAAALSRDYRLLLTPQPAPLLQVWGGKITTCRKLAEEALDQLAPLLGNWHGAWTAHACLPGGDIAATVPDVRSVTGLADFVASCQQRYHWLPPALVQRYVNAYGTRLHRLLEGCRQMADMGEWLAPGLCTRELDYLMQYEWAQQADDVLWRRSHLGLQLPAAAVERLSAWMQARCQDHQHALPP